MGMASVHSSDETHIWQRAVLAGIPEIRDGRWIGEHLELPHVVRHHGTTLYFGRLTCRLPDDRPEQVIEIVVKVSTPPLALAEFNGLERLWAAGFHAPSPYRVPKVLGLAERHGAIVMEWVRGQPWIESLADDPRRDTVAARVADWLLALQSCGSRVDLEPSSDRHDRIEPMAEELAVLAPASAAHLKRLGMRLNESLRLGGPPVPSHGDFHPKNVYYDSSSVTAIDCERVTVQEAASDVGWAIGQLPVMSYFRLGALAPGAAAAWSFWNRYSAEGQATWDRVRVHVARTFLEALYYTAVVLRSPASVPINRWIDLIDAWRVSSPDLLDALRRPDVAR